MFHAFDVLHAALSKQNSQNPHYNVDLVHVPALLAAEGMGSTFPF